MSAGEVSVRIVEINLKSVSCGSFFLQGYLSQIQLSQQQPFQKRFTGDPKTVHHYCPAIILLRQACVGRESFEMSLTKLRIVSEVCDFFLFAFAALSVMIHFGIRPSIVFGPVFFSYFIFCIRSHIEIQCSRNNYHLVKIGI